MQLSLAPRPTSRGGPPGLVQVASLVLFFQWYSLARSWVTGPAATAYGNARAILTMQRWLHLPAESTVQAGLLRHLEWVPVVNILYGAVHFVVPLIALVLLYRTRPNRYRLAVRVFVAMNAMALLVFAMFPLMPPRLLPAGYHIVDIGARYATLPADQALANGRGNGFAAMPSLHIGYAVWVCFALWPLIPKRWRPATLLYPVVMSLVVVVTGNHYWLDLVGGALIAVVAVRVATSSHAFPGLRRALELTLAPAVAAAAVLATGLLWLRWGFRLQATEDIFLGVGVLWATARIPKPAESA